MFSRFTPIMRFEGEIDAPFSHLLRLAETELRETMESLPSEIRESLRPVPVIFEEFPSPEAVADGIATDQLGVFDSFDSFFDHFFLLVDLRFDSDELLNSFSAVINEGFDSQTVPVIGSPGSRAVLSLLI